MSTADDLGPVTPPSGPSNTSIPCPTLTTAIEALDQNPGVTEDIVADQCAEAK